MFKKKVAPQPAQSRIGPDEDASTPATKTNAMVRAMQLGAAPITALGGALKKTGGALMPQQSFKAGSIVAGAVAAPFQNKREVDKMKVQLEESKRAADTGEIIIEVLSATGLKREDADSKAGEKAGTGDWKRPSPYALLELRGREQKTKKVAETLDPTWNQRFAWAGMLGELVAEPLDLAVMTREKDVSSELGGGVAMGTAEVSLKELLRSGGTLELKAPLSTHGEVRLKASWMPRVMGKVVVKLEGAHGLNDPEGEGDGIYASLRLKNKDRRTAVAKGTLSPEWQQRFEWPGERSDLLATPLTVEVRHKDPVYLALHGKAPVLGSCEVDLRALFEAQKDGAFVKKHALELKLSPAGNVKLAVHWETGANFVGGGEGPSALSRDVKKAKAKAAAMKARSLGEQIGDDLAALEKGESQLMSELEEMSDREEAIDDELSDVSDLEDDLQELQREIQVGLDEFDRQHQLIAYQPRWQRSLRRVRDAAFMPNATLPGLAQLILEELCAGAGLATQFAVGMRVRHPKRGLGEVNELLPDGRIQIKFDGKPPLSSTADILSGEVGKRGGREWLSHTHTPRAVGT